MIIGSLKKILSTLFFLSILSANAQVQFISGSLKIALNDKGFFTEISNLQSGKNYLYTDTIAPLITLISNHEKYIPTSLAYNKSNETIRLVYKAVDVAIEIKLLLKRHISYWRS